MNKKSSIAKVVNKIPKKPSKKNKENPFKKAMSQAKKLIQADNLNNTVLARQQLWTVTVLEIALFRKQFPSFLDSDKDGFETPWKIKIENECKKLRTIIARSIMCSDLEIVEKEIDFRLDNGNEPLVDIISGENSTEKPMDFYFLFSHKEPGLRPAQLLKELLNQEYPIPRGLIRAIVENRYQEAGELIWGLHQNMIYWLCSDKKLPADLFPFPLEEKISPEASSIPDPKIIRRETRKLATQAMHEDWQKEYLRLKKEKPGRTKRRGAEKIAKMDIAQGRASETIRKNMEGH